MKPFARRAFLGGVFAAAIGCKRAEPALVVFAAASVEDALRAHEAERRSAPPELAVKFSFAASGVLAQQVAATRAADVFLSADEQWVQWLADRALIEPGTRKNLLGNTLVIAAREDAAIRLSSPAELASAGYDKLVLADPESVPAGRYARSFLEGQRHAGGTLWQALAPRVAPQLDARATVAALLADPRRVGIVYASDLIRAPRLRALYRVPPEAAPPIVYSVAAIAGGSQLPAARAWIEGLTSPQAHAVFERFGFRVL